MLLIQPLKIKKLQVLSVYPTGANKGPKFYHGRKWAVVFFELTGEVKGWIDVPLPKECDDVTPIAAEAINREIRRGAYDGLAVPEKVTYRIDKGFAVANIGTAAA